MPKVLTPQLRFIVRNDRLALRCTFNGQNAEIKTELPSDGFDKKKQMFTKNRKLNIELDKLLTECEERIESGVTNVKDVLTKKVISKNTFTYLISEYIKENDLSDTTIEMWKSTLKHLIECFDDDKTKFKERQLIEYFEDKGLSDSTISLYLGKIHALGFTVNKKYIKKYKVAKREYCLTADQIHHIMKYYGNIVYEHREKEIVGWRGFEVFCIMLRTGLSPVDLFKLKRSQIKFERTNQRDLIVIEGKRSKTGGKFKIVVPQYSIIGDIYKKYDGCEHYLPYFDKDGNKRNRLSNFLSHTAKRMKEIVHAADSTVDIKQLTYYTARHSLATELMSKNIPIGQVALFLGRTVSGIDVYFHTLQTGEMKELVEAF